MTELAKYTLFHAADDSEWVLRRDGAERAFKRFPTKDAAIDELPDLFGPHSPASVKIQKQDGAIEEERTYSRSADPRKSPG